MFVLTPCSSFFCLSFCSNLEKYSNDRSQQLIQMRNDIMSKMDRHTDRIVLEQIKMGQHLHNQNESSKERQESLLLSAEESKKRDEEAEKRAEKRNEELLRSNKKLERQVDGLNGLIEEFRAAMTPQKKSVPTDVTVATAASSVPSINYRECVPDGMGGWRN